MTVSYHQIKAKLLMAYECQGSLYFPEAMDRPSVTAQFYWQAKENTSLRHESGPTQKMQREESPRLNFGPSFYVFFLLSLSLSCVNWSSQEGCLFYLRSSLQSSDLPLFYFCGLFSSLSFSHRHFGLLFPLLTT